ncbi:MAG: hypothetical protein PGN13_15420 [Patulibacter minatonensis]
MPKLPIRTATRRVVPGLVLVEVGRATHDHWRRQLSAAQRKRAVDLLKQSHGRPGKLTPRQRKQARELVKAFDASGYVKLVAATAAGAKARQRRR